MRTPLHRRVPKAFAVLLALGMLAGVLIWAKLRLAADIPRSALAEPEAASADGGGGDGAADGSGDGAGHGSGARED